MQQDLVFHNIMQHDLDMYLISSHFVTYSWKMLEIISSYVGSLLIDQEIIHSLSVQTTKIKNTNYYSLVMSLILLNIKLLSKTIGIQ